MSRSIVVVLLLCLLAASSVLAADDPKNIAGYGKTTWGMTPDEVLNAETSRAEKLENPEKFKTGLGIVKIQEIQIEVTKFSAIFIFDESGQKLQQVNLTSAEKKHPELNAFSFLSVEKLLTEKYGPPTYKEGTRVVSWKLPKTSINLTHLNITGLSQLTVSYKPTTSSGNAARDL